MTSSGAELIKLQEDTMKLQQRLVWYRAHQQITKLWCFNIWEFNPATLQPLNKTESSQRRTETVKPGGMSKEDQSKLIKNYVRLVDELPTTDITDYLR